MKKPRNPTGEELDLLDVGDEIFATSGEERLSPVEYNSFSVGPFSVKTKVRQGETGRDAFYRAMKICLQASADAYPEIRDEYIKRVTNAAFHVRKAARARKKRG